MVKMNTFSITARCIQTNQFGVAVATAIPGVGALCPYARAGVGAIASQSFVNPYIGINGLDYLEEGLSAHEVLERVLYEDPVPELRQIAIVDRDGNATAFTGEKCDTWNGHLTGENFAIAGNMLTGQETIQTMKETFETTEEHPLAERLLRALEAGQLAGGDKRGKQSAALYVVDTEDYPLVDLRVDEHTDPVIELRRIYTVAEQQLFPFIGSLPTKEYPAGTFDIEEQREAEILRDGG